MTKRKKLHGGRLVAVCGYKRHRTRATCSRKNGKLNGPSNKCRLNTPTNRCRIIRAASRPRRRQQTRPRNSGRRRNQGASTTTPTTIAQDQPDLTGMPPLEDA